MTFPEYPSLNRVTLIGRLAGPAQPGSDGSDRYSVLAVTTVDGGQERRHRVIVRDEFLAQSMHGLLTEGANVRIDGELAYDGQGAYVCIPPRRGCEVMVFGAGQPTAKPSAPPPVAPTSTPAGASQPEPRVQPATPAARPQTASAAPLTPRPVSTPPLRPAAAPQDQAPPSPAPQAAADDDFPGDRPSVEASASKPEQAPVTQPAPGPRLGAPRPPPLQGRTPGTQPGMPPRPAVAPLQRTPLPRSAPAPENTPAGGSSAYMADDDIPFARPD